MQSRLVVNNFGPIKHADLDLRNVNVFIGPQASGKSALAKLYTIFNAPRKFLKDTVNKNGRQQAEYFKAFKDTLEEYNIQSFLKEDTEIVFDSELHRLEYKEGVIAYEPKLFNKIRELEKLGEDFEKNRESIKIEIDNFAWRFLVFYSEARNILHDPAQDNQHLRSIHAFNNFQNLNLANFEELIQVLKEIEAHLSLNTALYIPTERNFINIIKNSTLNLLLNNVPIPKHILLFGAELEKIKYPTINLAFLGENLLYRNVEGEDRIYFDEQNSIKLTEAASGIQSIIPILLPILSYHPLNFQRSIVIEEPELNLFPLAQYGLIKIIEHKRLEPNKRDIGGIHTYTSHSPYILSAFNNLLYAYKVNKHLAISAHATTFINSSIKSIVPTFINPDNFTAYQIHNGGAESIFNREIGLIDDNFIDAASDTINDDFAALMEMMKNK